LARRSTPEGPGADPVPEPESDSHGVHSEGPVAPPPTRHPRHRRRVTTEPPPGTDPAPAPEPPRHVRGENDDRMRTDKPPHY